MPGGKAVNPHKWYQQVDDVHQRKLQSKLTNPFSIQTSLKSLLERGTQPGSETIGQNIGGRGKAAWETELCQLDY